MTAVTPIDQWRYDSVQEGPWKFPAKEYASNKWVGNIPSPGSFMTSSSPGTFGRQRAPTVSKDTSAVTNSDMENALPPGNISDSIHAVPSQRSETLVSGIHTFPGYRHNTSRLTKKLANAPEAILNMISGGKLSL